MTCHIQQWAALTLTGQPSWPVLMICQKTASSSVWDTDTTLSTLLPLQSGPIFECMSKYLNNIYS